MKYTTKNQAQKAWKIITPAAAALIRHTPKMARRIWLRAGVSRSYLSHAMAGRKPASEKLLLAISREMLAFCQRTEVEALRLEMQTWPIEMQQSWDPAEPARPPSGRK